MNAVFFSTSRETRQRQFAASPSGLSRDSQAALGELRVSLGMLTSRSLRQETLVFRFRSKLMTAAAVGAAAVGGAAIATAATSGSSSSSSASGSGSSGQQGPAQRDPSQAGHALNGKTEALLSGDKESKVRAAALAKVPGTVERVETNVDSSAPYEAHIRKSDGTEVEVQVGNDFTVSAVNEMGSMNGHP